MKQEDYYRKEEILSPEEEIELRTALDMALRENAELRQELERKNEQISQLKKAVYGQHGEKTGYVMEDGEQLSLFDEAECEENRREREVEEVIHPSDVSQCDDCGADT